MAKGIKVRILGDDSDLNAKLKDSREALSKWAVAAAAAAAVAAVAITKATADSAKEIDNLSRLVGENTTEFQRNAAAAKSVGIEQEKYADIMKDVRDKVGDFISTGAGPMADFFEKVGPKVGVTAEQFKKLNGRDALQLYVDSLEKANVSQNEMTFYMEAIASDAALLQPLLENSGEGFKKLGDRAEGAGAVLSQIDIAKMGLMQESIAESQELFKGLTNQIAIQFAPIMQGVIDLFLDSGISAGKMKKAVEKTFEFIIKGAGMVVDGVRGIHVIIKGIETAFWGLTVVTSKVFETIVRGVDDYVVRPIRRSINDMIDGINHIPGIEIDKLIDGEDIAVTQLAAVSDAAVAKMKETGVELHNLLMKPLPSKALNDFVDLAKEKADEAAKVIVETKNHVGLVVPDLPPATDTPEVIAEKEKADAMLAIYQDYATARMSSGEDFNKTEETKAKEFADKMKSIDEQRFNDQLSGASGFFGNLSSLMNTEHRALFAVGKAAAISGAVVDGIAAAVGSFKVGAQLGGPLLGAAYAAASGVATGAQIAGIVSTSFGSGASTSAGSPSVSPPTAVQGGQPAATGGGGNNNTLFVEGISDDQMFSGEAVRSLASKLVDFQRDGGQVVLA